MHYVAIDSSSKELVAACSCPQFERASECKHIAATLYALLEGPQPQSDHRPPTAPPQPVQKPASSGAFAHYGDEPQSVFLNILKLYQPNLPLPSVGSDWGRVAHWQHALQHNATFATHIHTVAENHFRTMLDMEARIRGFQPNVAVSEVLKPVADALQTAFAGILPTATAILAPPEPMPWTFGVDAANQRFSAKFAGYASVVTVNLETNAVWTIEHKGLALAALRAALLELATPTSPITKQLVTVLEVPRWSLALDRLERMPRPEEYAFVVRTHYGSLHIDALKRSRAKAHARWSRATSDAVLNSPTASALEREIVRWADMAKRMAPDVHAVTIPMLERLAQHPRVFADGNETAMRVGVEQARLRFARTKDAVEATLGWREGDFSPQHVADLLRHRALVVSRPASYIAICLPTELAPWATELARTRAAKLSFPVEAYSRLAKSLTANNFIDAPADVSDALMGERTEHQPMPALAVEWGKLTTIALLITVAPGAPLMRAGEGDVRFTYVVDGQPRWVERDVARELEVVAEAKQQLSLVDWGGSDVGCVATLDAILALADFVAQLPRGWSVETRLGKPPRRIRWSHIESSIAVAKAGEWFSCRGDLQLGDAHVSLGELLESLRRAQRFIAIGDGQHLELPETLRKQLEPLAFAANTEQGSLRVHGAFGDVVREATTAFTTATSEVDWHALAQNHTETRPRVPKLRNGTLRDYQVEGVRWMLERAACTPGCVLADDMGLGKTVQTAAFLLARRGRGTALIVAPASVTFNWKLELARFAPQLGVVLFNETRCFDVAASKRADVVIVSYGLLQRDPNVFNDTWSTLVLDEAQYLKNHVAKRTTAVRDLKRDFTIALTGTPVENHLGELWSVMSLAFPGLLGSEPAFRSRFRDNAGASELALATLNRLLAPFLLRRTRANVLSELPERQNVDVMIDLSAAERKRYDTLRRACELQFVERDVGLTAAQEKIQILAALTRLRQMACDVKLVEPKFKGESAKLERLKALCQDLADQGAAVLVFSQFTQLLTRARDQIAGLGIATHYLDGATPLSERQRLVTEFQNGSGTVFFISLKAGGTGLNLTRACYVIHLDPWWNPAVEEQANSRAHRMGQSRPVTAYRLIARGTVEESILSLHEQKRGLALSVLDGKAAARTLSKDDFMRLLRDQAEL